MKFENMLAEVPDAGELTQVTDMVKATKAELDKAKAEVLELRAETSRLGSKADAQQGKIESLTLDIQVKSRRINDF